MTKYIKDYLNEFFLNREEFIRCSGFENITNSKFMLVADFLSEYTDELAEIIVENNKKTNNNDDVLKDELVFNAKHRSFTY